MNKINIQELSDRDLEILEERGQLGQRTKDIVELQNFYFYIDNERKRRSLKLKELQKVLPIGKYFRVNSELGSFIFKVVECCNAFENMHITHFCKVEGLSIINNKLNKFETLSTNDFQIDDSVEFGWNAKSQEMIFWIKGCFAPYEVIEETKDSFEHIINTFNILGFDI